MKLLCFLSCFIFLNSVIAQNTFFKNELDSIPADLPLPIIKISNNPSRGYLFTSVPYWGKGNFYLVIYNNDGRPVFFRETKSICTDFKLHDNGLITYFDYSTKKFYAMDSTMVVADSFWVKNGYETDEHDIKFLKNGNILLIGLDYKLVDMSKYVDGGDRNASVVVNVIQEIDPNKNLVFEWKSDEHYKYTDVGKSVNLLDVSFVHSHINSVDVDEAGNLVVSARNLDEISKIDRKNGDFIWRFGGKNNQFKYVNDSLGFFAQHSVSLLQNGNLLIYDNGLDHIPPYSRVIEYKLDEKFKTATAIWSYRNNPDIVSNFWGNVQRLDNGNTFISWGLNKIAATEVNANKEKVYEIEFPQDVYSYRIFKVNLNNDRFVSVSQTGEEIKTPRLEQNYPNPFNPVTSIKYSISKSSFVNLIVYDMLGREVIKLINEERLPGNYEVKFDGRDLTSGVYFYFFKTAEYTSVKKLILLK